MDVPSEGSHEPLPFEIILGAKPQGNAVDMYAPVSPFAAGAPSGVRSSDFESTSEPGSGQPKFVDANESMVAECYISFEKLLKNIIAFSARKDEQMLEQEEGQSMLRKSGELRKSEALKKVVAFMQEKEFTDKLWYCGNQIGTVSGSLRFINLPYL